MKPDFNSDMIDFEEAIKKYGPDFHGKHGFPGMMGDMPKKSDGKSQEKPEDPIHMILKHQQEQAKKSAESPKMMKTGDGGQVVFETPDAQTGHSKTPVTQRTPTSDASPVPLETSREDADDTKAETPVEDQATPTPAVEDEPVEQPVVASSSLKEEETAHVKDEL